MSKARDVIAVGEAGLRLMPAPGSSLENATCFEMDVVGAEANVAANLARLGRRVGWVSSLPDTVLGARVEGAIRAHGVDTSGVVWMTGKRVALHYCESNRTRSGRGCGGAVLCDRADSAYCHLTPDQIDWSHLLDTRWLHVTCNAMAASALVRTVVGQAVEAARAAGVFVSLDVNCRATQWTAQDVQATVVPLLGDVDLLFCAARDARRAFGLAGPDEEVLDGLAALTSADKIVMSVGASGLIARSGSQRFCRGGETVVSVDRAGTGDALATGVLHGLLDGDFPRGLDCGQALTALSRSRRGAQVVVTAEELDRLVEHGCVNGRPFDLTAAGSDLNRPSEPSILVGEVSGG